MKHSYITLPNSIVSHNLSRCETAILIMLHDVAQKYGTRTMLGYDVKVKQATLAAKCGVAIKTINRCVASLISKGYILGQRRTVREDRTLSTYVYSLPNISKFFYIPRKALKLVLSDSPSALREYLYCCKSKTQNGYFYHSYNDISDTLGIKRSDVIRHIAMLEAVGAIKKCRKKTASGRYTENTYIVFRFSTGTIKEKVLSQNPLAIAQSQMKIKKLITCIITHCSAIVKQKLKKLLFGRRR